MWQVYSIIAAIFYGINNLISKHVMKDTEAEVYAATYNLTGAACFLLFINQFIMPANNNVWILVIISSIMWAVILWAINNSYKYLDVSLAAPLNNTVPGLVLILGIIFLNEGYGIQKIIGTLLIILGSIILTTKTKKYKVSRKGIMFIITSIILIGFVRIIDKIASVQFTTPFYGFILFLLPGLILLPFAVKKHKKTRIKPKKWALMIMTGIFYAIGYSLVLDAYKITEVSNVTPLISTNLIVSVMGGFIIFKEKGIKKKVIGTLLIILGSILII